MSEMLLTEDQVADVIRHLETADDNHHDWLRDLHASLICGKPFQQDVFSEQAHCECRFGRWYYGNSLHLLHERPDYVALDSLHKSMHDSARNLANMASADQPIPSDMYCAFVQRQQEFSDRLLGLRDVLRECLFTFDALTGVMTRDPFMKMLNGELERLRRKGSTACIAMLDIDHFKTINDQHGHLMGDRVLRVMGQFLVRRLRAYDSVCRFGGEEFLFCLPGVTLEEGHAIMDRIRADMAELKGRRKSQMPFVVTASIGVAPVDDKLPLEANIRRADDALYQAKADGRDRTVGYVAART